MHCGIMIPPCYPHDEPTCKCAAVLQVDRATGRMLYWRDDVVRVRPFRRDSQAAWRLRRVSHSECPQWAGVLSRRNQTVGQWAARIAATVLGECDANCMHTASAVDTSAVAAAPAAAITAAAHGRTNGPLSSLSALPLALTPYLGSLRWLDHAGRMTICAIACRHLVVRRGPTARAVAAWATGRTSMWMRRR